MRLLSYDSNNNIRVSRDLADSEVRGYAILSHTWGKDEEEVTFHEIGSTLSQQKSGYRKIKFCGDQARQDGKQDGWYHFWVDTCCIDKTNHTELSKAITSMYRWYQQAQTCYVYLADVSSRPRECTRTRDPIWESSFRQSRWFQRGWTLQELLAPRNVVFYSKEWSRLGTKEELRDLLSSITSIPTAALEGQPLSQFPVIERMRWTQGRQTKEKEDQAYCLLGIFGVYMYLNYGEGDNAFRRLQRELDVQSGGELVKSVHDYNFQSPVGLCIGRAPCMDLEYFIGRDDEFNEMDKVLLSTNDQHRLILGGMGGIGKTQLALNYARRPTRQYDSVFWLNATSEAALTTSFQLTAKRIFSAQAYQAIDQQHLLNYVHSWLSHPRNTRWLLVFDNYDDPDTYDVRAFYPDTAHGSIIITTRRPDLVGGKQLPVKPLQSLKDGLQILQTRSGRDNIKDDIGASRLAKRLAGLPLALATAGAFLRKSVWTSQQYLDAYEERWNVTDRRPLVLTEYQDRTLYTTWELSYDRLKTEYPDAARLLKLFAYFDHQALWYSLLCAGRGDDIPDWMSRFVDDPNEFEGIMQILVDYCFLETQLTTQTYSIHTCVHDWVVSGLNQPLEPWSYRYAFDCIASSIHSEDWNSLGHVKYARLTPHAIRLVDARFDTIRRELAEVHLQRAEYIAYLLQSQVQHTAAEQIYIQALAGREKALGTDHASTLTTVNNLGILYADQGKLVEAEQMYRRALAGYEKILGADHTSTLHTVHNLGLLYSNQGKLVEAEQMYRRALAGKEKALGADHTLTLITVNNLGILYVYKGKLAEAEQLCRRALAGYEKALGADHISTLNAVHNLGAVYMDQGKLVEAEQMYHRVLAGKEKALGVDHTTTLKTVNKLGLLYSNQGKLADAEQMYRRALARYEKVSGADHISTLNVVNNLGVLYMDQGKLAEAEQMYHRAQAGYQKVCVEDHPDKLAQTLDHANLFVFQLELEKAKQLYQQTIDICANSLPGTTTRSQSAANTYTKALSKMVCLRKSSFTDARPYLCSLIEYLRQEDQITTMMIQCLAKALLHLRDDENAELALFFCITDSMGPWLDFGEIRCDACHHRLNTDKGMNVCRQCVDTNFCDACLSTNKHRESLMPKCQHNQFYNLGGTIRRALQSSQARKPTEMNTWLDKLGRQYAVALG